MAENLGIHTPDTPDFDQNGEYEVHILPYAILFFVVVFLVVGIYYLPQILQFIK